MCGRLWRTWQLPRLFQRPVVVAGGIDEEVRLAADAVFVGPSLLAAHGKRVPVPVPGEVGHGDVGRAEGQPELAVSEAVLLKEYNLVG